MENQVIRNNSRGTAEYEWLHSRHSFSFANYYEPDRLSFGTLRVLNDDIVEPKEGFTTHSHNNMEIISIVLEGILEHQDSMNHKQHLMKDDVQILTAGSGIEHSEFNGSETEQLQFLQIWIKPKERNLNPRYDQKSFPINLFNNKFLPIVSGINIPGTLHINQDAVISRGILDSKFTVPYIKNKKDNLIYFFLLDGNIIINDVELRKRDAYQTGELDLVITAKELSNLLIIEIPEK